MLRKIPYDRAVQWLAGPVSGAVGYGFSLLVTHVGVVGELAKGHEADISRAIVQATSFGIGTIATYAAHHQWQQNLQSWWNSSAKVAEEITSKIDPTALPDVEQFVTDPRKVIEEIIAGQDAAAQIQEHPELLENAKTPMPFGEREPQSAPEQAQSAQPTGDV